MFQNLTPYLEFAINQQFISENLCENRDNPDSNCNGHCQLRKMLTEDDDNSRPIEIRFRTDVDYWYSVVIESVVPVLIAVEISSGFEFKSTFYNSSLQEIDPPPPRTS
ncbi:MAG: hypothetical protein KDC92_07100 [Bacteroidetes bacterium]|nr:hypothetical protein [Bacteroidota bacterium]